MGNNQASPVVCGLPADNTLTIGRQPTSEEVGKYVASVRAAVEGHVETFEDRFKRYMDGFTPSTEQLKAATDAFAEELELGLGYHAANPGAPMDMSKCSLKMLDAFVQKAPDGKESGVYWAVDFGGSNFRILRCEINNGNITLKSKKACLTDAKCEHPKGLLDPKASAAQMFDFFAGVAHEFLTETGDINATKPMPLGFTFSFPCLSRSLSRSDLVVWTKGFETGRDTQDPVEGRDVGLLLNLALSRKKLPLEVNCVANDTVGTLLSCAYSLDPAQHPPCAVGIILGTGTNTAYIDERARSHKYAGSIINTECGNFNRCLPRTNLDYEVDFDDVGGRGRQAFEKMISGAYLGELCRRAIVKILQYKATPRMWQQGSFTSEDASICLGDKSESLIVVHKKAKEVWEADLTTTQLRWVRDICGAVFRRSAYLAAVNIAGTAIKTGRLQEAMGGLTVGVDGSLWKCNPQYRIDLRQGLEDILGQSQAALIHIVKADDGSGVGAAILAAIA